MPEDGREWLHLLPGGGRVETVDGRGPYTVEDYDALIAASLTDGERLVLDECHSTDLAAPLGQPAPARGWIVALEARQDGIWGQVEWTGTGRQLREDKAYRGISPVIAHTKNKQIVAIRRASLVNQPNLKGLEALHAEENGMDFMKAIAAALGLGDDATEEAILAAVKKMSGGSENNKEMASAINAALQPIATALALQGAVTSDAILTRIGTLREGVADETAITALQSQLVETTKQFNALQASISLQAAQAFVDGAIAEGRVGVKPMRDRYIAMHQKDPKGTEELIAAMPAVASEAVSLHGRQPARTTTDLDEADRAVIALMGIDPAAFKKARAAELGIEEEVA
ncbi:phage protease [Erythrobacter ramosus]|nr:phage protease [Erythrobacter ramosus]